MAHFRIRPARHVNYSTELMTNVRGVHGFEGYCSCGWVGRTWGTHDTARYEASWHYFSEHGYPDAAQQREEAQATASEETS